MKRTWTLAAIILALAVTPRGHAQDETWSDAMDQAVTVYNEGDLVATVAALEQAVILAESPVESAQALLSFSYVRFRQERLHDALGLTERALNFLPELLETGDHNALSVAADLWNLRAELFNSQGKDDEQYQALIRAAEYKQRLPQPGWRIANDGAATHLLSGFTCPATVSDLPRAVLSTFSASGNDVGCRYAVGGF